MSQENVEVVREPRGSYAPFYVHAVHDWGDYSGRRGHRNGGMAQRQGVSVDDASPDAHCGAHLDRRGVDRVGRPRRLRPGISRDKPLPPGLRSRRCRRRTSRSFASRGSYAPLYVHAVHDGGDYSGRRGHRNGGMAQRQGVFVDDASPDAHRGAHVDCRGVDRVGRPRRLRPGISRDKPLPPGCGSRAMSPQAWRVRAQAGAGRWADRLDNVSSTRTTRRRRVNAT